MSDEEGELFFDCSQYLNRSVPAETFIFCPYFVLFNQDSCSLVLCLLVFPWVAPKVSEFPQTFILKFLNLEQNKHGFKK